MTTQRPRRFAPQVLDPDEVHALMQACSPNAPTGIRNRALIAVLYRAGLRISESLTLYPRHVDRTRSLMRIDHAKGGKSRVVGMDHGAWAVLDRWLDRRATLSIGARQPVFCTLHGTPLADAYIRRLLPRLAAKAGIDRRVHAHALRHTHAAELRFEGVDIGVIAKQLGHTSIATTARYLDHIAPTSVIDAMRQRNWPPELAPEHPFESTLELDPDVTTQVDRVSRSAARKPTRNIPDHAEPDEGDGGRPDDVRIRAMQRRIAALERALSAQGTRVRRG